MKIKLTNNSTYAEVGQVNPLRWKTMFKDGDNSFVDQSGWWKCKDFLNDCVAFFKEGTKFSIYGWNNAIKKNEEGVYHYLKNIGDTQKFLYNLEVVNKRLNEDLGCAVDYLPGDQPGTAIILLPTAVWESTYRISLITLLIRLCNYDQQFGSWADIWKKGSVVYTDGAFTPDAIKMANELGFHVPDEYKQYWYFAGDAHNSVKQPKLTGYIIHDNGCVGWNQWMKKTAAKKEKAVAV
jgi:hypothetical protein